MRLTENHKKPSIVLMTSKCDRLAHDSVAPAMGLIRLRHAATKRGYPCEVLDFQVNSEEQLLLDVENGKYDIIIAGMSITEERKQKVNFTNGYMNDGARFWVLKDSGLANISVGGVTKVNMNNAGGKENAAVGQMIAAFEGKNVCVQSSTTHANFATQYMSTGSNVKLYQTVDDHNIDLMAGRCDAVLSDVASAVDFMATDQGSNAAFTGPTFSGGPWGDGVGGAIRKEDTDILEMWNKAIAEMSADGTTAKITEKWFGRDMSM